MVKATHKSTFAIAGTSCYADSFVVAQGSVLLKPSPRLGQVCNILNKKYKLNKFYKFVTQVFFASKYKPTGKNNIS
jgi:hypothetical protein